MKHDYLDALFGLSGQTAIVVGGTGVLGGALADGLAAAGAHVVVAGRNAERGETRVAAIIKEQSLMKHGYLSALLADEAYLEFTIVKFTHIHNP